MHRVTTHYPLHAKNPCHLQSLFAKISHVSLFFAR
ncbi:hypothetical protein SLEP1_g29253 [Rubroshorea leprosula]|uniref:Uncharacterized protein n=1 Tax=Rubroshorea leprosula TaxID=152421 RepID=A0AAV5JYU7_9ROSI|nr:hypothetical protein SLEP1_g29253 [Rubroshorea leprosula]